MRKQPRTDLRTWGIAAGGAGAAALATAATACCVPVIAPLLISLLGVGGAVWAAGLKPYSLWILVAAGLVLGYGFVLVYRRRPAPEGAVCRRRGPRGVRVVLWASALLWLVALVLNVLELVAPAAP